MDPVNPDTLPDYAGAALSGGEMLLIFMAITVILGALMIGLFLMFNGPRGRSRASRSSRERDAERLRSHKDLVARIHSYSRRCEEAILNGMESPEQAALTLQHYGDGVLDSVMSNTRNVKQIDGIRALVGDETDRLRALSVPAVVG